MEFFTTAIDVLKTLVVALGAGLGVWGIINLLAGVSETRQSKGREGNNQATFAA
jgi:hypothetical protein